MDGAGSFSASFRDVPGLASSRCDRSGVFGVDSLFDAFLPLDSPATARPNANLVAIAHDAAKQSFVFWRYACPGPDDSGLSASAHAAWRFAARIVSGHAQLVLVGPDDPRWLNVSDDASFPSNQSVNPLASVLPSITRPSAARTLYEWPAIG